jgi:hypothetical protein
MKIKEIGVLFLTVFIVSIFSNAIADSTKISAVTSEGKTVVLDNDGTWEYESLDQEKNNLAETNYLKESAKKATDIYVAFFKSYVSKEIPEEERKCLIDTLESVSDSDYANLGPPITTGEDVKDFYEAVKNVKLLPNGKLLSDFGAAQAVAQPMEFISKLACK